MSFLTSLTDADYKNLEAYLKTVSGAGAERLSGTGNATIGGPLFRKACTGCHSINHGTNPAHGPDLNAVPNAPTWIQAFIAEPFAMATHAYTPDLLNLYPYIMPDRAFTDNAALDLQAFITLQQYAGPLLPTTPVTLTAAEFEQTKQVYFNHCAGCHGLYRKGATGPNIEQVRSQAIGTDGLGSTIHYGTPGGMPNLGQSNILTPTDITKLSSYLQLPPPTPPALSMAEIQASWNLVVPVAQRPTTPQTSRNWENYFGVVLRDAGKIAIYDGDTKEEVVKVNVGFAVHILRSSSSGRYFYAIGRDGLVSLIDLWAGTPNIVATVKGCHDARSVEASKFAGYEDSYLIEGCYWPPQYVVFNGLTLEPLARNDLPMNSITGETLPEVRVASIVASPSEPLWLISLKESGYVGLVDYSQPGFPLVQTIACREIPARRWLGSHRSLLPGGGQCQQQDGGHRYRHAQPRGQFHHRRQTASGSRRQLGRSGLWLGQCHAASGREQDLHLRRGSGGSSGACLESGPRDHATRIRIAVPENASELAVGVVRHGLEHG